MTAARTTWRAKPCGWRDRERVVALGEEFGPAGPLMLDLLEEHSKEQRGSVRAGLRSLARGAFLPRGAEGIDLARQILVFASKVGALDELTIVDDVAMTVECRVSGFAQDQGTGYESVKRAMSRAASCPDSGDTVPVCPPTGQDRTEEKTPHGQVARDLFGYWQERCGHPKAKATPGRLRAVTARLKEGYEPAQIRQAIDGAATAAYVNDAGVKFDDLALICRNGEKLEQFIARSSSRLAPVGGDTVRHNREALLAHEKANREARAAREASYAQEVPA